MYRLTATVILTITLIACGSNNESNNESNSATTNAATNAQTNASTNNQTTAATNGQTGETNGAAAGEGTFTFSLVVNGDEASVTCVDDREFGEVDELGVAYAGDQANVSCPAVTGVAISNPSAFVALKDYESLPAAFTFTEADAGTEFELAGDAGGMGSAESLSHNTATAVTLTGTWDAATRQLVGTVDATFEERDGFGGGTLEGSFNVIVPE